MTTLTTDHSPKMVRDALCFAEGAREMPGDMNLITSRGPAATQTVPHLHLHLIPRREGDGLTLPWTAQQATPA